MTQSLYNITGNERNSQRFTANLQRHSRLLLQADRELQKATRAKSEFVSKMSHEFRAALNVIIGFTELMLDEVPGPINQQQEHSLKDILASSRRLQALVVEYLKHPEIARPKAAQSTGKSR